MFSDSFKINVNKNASEERLISLVRVAHPTLEESVRLVQDTLPIIFGNEEYIPFPMVIKMDNQSERELPVAQISIPNAARQITKWVDESMGARGGTIEIIITRRSTLEREYGVVFNIDSVSITSDDIIFKVSVQDNLTRPAIRWVYDTTHAIGLF